MELILRCSNMIVELMKRNKIDPLLFVEKNDFRGRIILAHIKD